MYHLSLLIINHFVSHLTKYLLTVSFMQTSSLSSKSRKRKREVSWMDVLDGTSIIDNEIVMSGLEVMSVEDYCRLPPSERNIL